MTSNIGNLWSEIEGHLAAHAETVLPTLNPPASEAEIKSLERFTGEPIPEDLRESLLIHNGQSDPSRLQILCDAGTLLSVADMHRVWTFLTDTDAGMGPPPNGIVWWNPKYLPFTDYEGDHLCLDRRPDSLGEVVWQIHDGEIERNIHPTYTAWLTSVRDVFAQNRFRVEDGYLDFWLDS